MIAIGLGAVGALWTLALAAAIGDTVVDIHPHT